MVICIYIEDKFVLKEDLVQKEKLNEKYIEQSIEKVKRKF